MRRLLRITFWLGAAALGVVVLALVLGEVAVSWASAGRNYDDVAAVPEREAAVVLGTSKFVREGRENLHYRYRINAAAELFHAGRVRYLIVSGNGLEANYNEPDAMRKDLIALGVPEDRIYRDDAGLRTLDSVVRAGSVFGAPDFVVVSQPEHNARAIFVGRALGQDVVGYRARVVPFRVDPKTAVRERLARVLAILDVTVLDNRPKESGETVRLGTPEPARTAMEL